MCIENIGECYAFGYIIVRMIIEQYLVSMNCIDVVIIIERMTPDECVCVCALHNVITCAECVCS